MTTREIEILKEACEACWRVWEGTMNFLLEEVKSQTAAEAEGSKAGKQKEKAEPLAKPEAAEASALEAKPVKKRELPGAEPERAEPETPSEAPAAESLPPRALEEVRALLAEKSRKGYRAEVKALLTANGLEKLSDAAGQPELLGRLYVAAREMGG